MSSYPRNFLLPNTTIIIVLSAEVEIGLNGSVYRVVEGDSKVIVVVESVGGGLERKVSVLLSTKDGSAKSEKKLLTLSNYCYVWILW